VRWTGKGLIIRLRQGFYSFPEYKGKADYIYYFANRIYRPSYISLHTALAFYGMIPEAVVQITSVSSLKTADFRNEFGEFSYKSIKSELMFGYDLKPMEDGFTLAFATPEKALLDLLYIYPFYNSTKDMELLRLDEDYLHESMKKDQVQRYTDQFKNRALEQRVKILINTYAL
jgi:predicted transcriptional regulator of viral defense system